MTKTEDEQDPQHPHKPFPKKLYIKKVLNFLDRCPGVVKLLPKSRTMLCSWSVAAWSAHMGFNRPATCTIFQSADEERAVHDVNYVKTLWKNSDQALKNRWPARKDVDQQPTHEFRLQNGSRWVALTGNPNKIRSEHPTIYVCDEAAHYEEFEEAYNTSVGCNPLHIICLSSAYPGPFADMDMSAVPVSWPPEFDHEELSEERKTLAEIDPDDDADYEPQFVMDMGAVSSMRAESHIRRPAPGLLYLETPDGHAVLRVHHTADPDKRTPEWREAKEKQFSTPTMARQELDIDHHAQSGALVFPEFDESIHVIPHEKIPRRLCIYQAIDPHPRTPCAALWIGVDQWEDLYVFRELWPSKYYAEIHTPRDGDNENHYPIWQYCGTMAYLEGNEIRWENPETAERWGQYIQSPAGEVVIERFMDQAGKGFIATQSEDSTTMMAETFANCGIECSDPLKRRKAGYDAIHEVLELRHHAVFGKWPRLHISNRCRELILEMKRHRFKTRRGGLEDEELWQRGVKARRHLIDNLRYLVTADLTYIPAMESRRHEAHV